MTRTDETPEIHDLAPDAAVRLERENALLRDALDLIGLKVFTGRAAARYARNILRIADTDPRED